jgi:ABC-type transporter Mla maintaining outer membrane lipid asymmetry ATPase subunit MlaF
MEGEIILQGTPAEFIASDHPKVRAFLQRDRDTSHFAA